MRSGDLTRVIVGAQRASGTLQLLWVEYQQAVVSRNDGVRPYQYSQFCDLYADFGRS